VFIGDVWPTSDEVHALMKHAMNPKVFQASYGNVKKNPGGPVAEDRGRQRTGLWLAEVDLHRPNRRFSDGFSMQPAAMPAVAQRARAGHLRRLRLPPTTSRRPAASRTPRPPASG